MLGIRTVGAAVAAVMGTLLVLPDAHAGRPRELDGTPLCGAAASLTDRIPTPDDGALKVATFNLLHSETDDGDVSLGDRLPMLAQAIAASGADVVGAQEVTRNATFAAAAEAPQKHGLVAQRLAQAVANLTGQTWQWCWSLSNPHVPLTPDVGAGGGNPLDALAASMGNFPEAGDFSEGLAILTRFSITDSRFRRLAPRSYEAPLCAANDAFDPFCVLDAAFDSRQVLWARVATPDGGIDMFTTHIAHHLTDVSDRTKLLQTAQVLQVTREWATPDALPDFLVGDFNSTSTSKVHAAALRMRFVDSFAAAGGAECTAPGVGACSADPPLGDEVFTDTAIRPMAERIDYVFARPPRGCALKVPISHVMGDTPSLIGAQWVWPSDHLGFVSAVSC